MKNKKRRTELKKRSKKTSGTTSKEISDESKKNSNEISLPVKFSSGNLDSAEDSLAVKKRVKTDDSEEKGPKKPRKRIQRRKKETGVTQQTQVLGKDAQ